MAPFRIAESPQGHMDDVVITDDRVEELVTELRKLEDAKDEASEVNKRVRKSTKRIKELLPEREVGDNARVRIGNSPYVIQGGQVERNIAQSFSKEERQQYAFGRSSAPD